MLKIKSKWSRTYETCLIRGIWIFNGILLVVLVIAIGLFLKPGYSQSVSRNSSYPSEVILVTEPGLLPVTTGVKMHTVSPANEDMIRTVSPYNTKSVTTPLFPSKTMTPAPTSTITVTRYFEGPLIIGYSVLNRPIEVFRFGTGMDERMVIAGIHGGYEWNTVNLADEMINYLRDNPGFVPDNRTLYILRVLNPDGYARARDYSGRTNSRGVDLNRNWDSHWLSQWPMSGCWTLTTVSAGDYPGSEPETVSLADFILAHRIKILINYHSAGLGIFAGGQPPDARSLALAEAVSSVSPYPYPPFETGCIFTGQFIDWASDHGIAALDVELKNHKDIDLDINLRILRVVLDWEG